VIQQDVEQLLLTVILGEAKDLSCYWRFKILVAFGSSE